ncbi:MAG: glycerol-3-phosphate 1-O-acyltransferase PlsY [Bacteroidota bacterium]|nr:glycerol-3-phosphate 1-O-acyltransferase PlsY [Bacteroidota bacterium]
MEVNYIVISLVLFCFALGSIPFSIIVSKLFFQVDLRTKGSGNPGATNALRNLGWKPGLIILLLDMAKGSAAIIISKLFNIEGIHQIDFACMCGMSAVLGHIYSPFLYFKGGKGVATSLGVIIFLEPVIALIAVAVFVIITYLSKYVSLASICALAIFTILITYIRYSNPIEVIFALMLTGLVVFRHQANIIRLIKGDESKLNFKQTH